ncbi:SpoIIE family protein phosphatase [Planotetraspora sp. A-T 1434]|uniref:SpoIIE family protein phosphatase n=1 Tax=Planotetraspora sp. A-T 1434 TaxID=2979219 RepID=UPI0021C24C36|nr:SpoIIE family protein phosphatase [Planotetraspora sp. A-T 1434]MCT9930451.1 SpoIIE family protein phosphatase [Planotetraspora sp. A-T 1434]
MADIAELERALSGLADRIATLRDKPEPGAALRELEAAEELLRSALGELVRGRRRKDGGNQREQKLLRQVFRALPVPVIIMDTGGTVRRINNETTRLLGSPAGYLIGRAFPLLIDVASRAAFRSHLTAVLRSEESAAFQTRLAHQGRTHTVRLVLSRLRMPGEPQEMIAAVALPTEVQLLEAPDPGGAPDESVIMAAARRHELLSRLTRLLLDEESLREPVALIRAARLLAAETADWVVADVIRDGVLHRATVIGPSDQPITRLQRAMETMPPAAAPIVGQVLATQSGIVHEMLSDDSLLGGDVLQAMRAGSLLSVPIRTDDEVRGVLTLVRLRDRPPFGLADLGLLEEIGLHLGLAMRAQRSFQRRAHAADTLQTGVLPRTLPDIPGFETAAIYHPGSGLRAIGGEFYDVFPVKNGWGFMIGSAAGRGEEAAAVTAMVRNGLRVLSVYESDPGEALRKVNDALVAQNTGLFVMAAAGFVRGRKVRLASAGHHPAALLQPDGGVRFSDGGGVPLGFEEGSVPATEELTLAAGETLVLYSDGLVGSQSAAGENYGEDRLTEVLARCVGQPPAGVVKAIEEDHRAFCGAHVVDEITVLTLRRSR